MITLPVSVGEAIDKLTILDIKCRKIKDSQHSKREYDILYEALREYVTSFPYQYKILRSVNEEIWNLQDEIREMSAPSGEKCIEILNKNDMRFRIKDNINKLTQSYLREQKGYAPRRALVIAHLGLGDHIGLNGAVRFLALQYDEVAVVVRDNNYLSVKAMYADNPAIRLLVFGNRADYLRQPTSTSAGECIDYNPEDYTAVYRSGFYAYPRHGFDELPHTFYRDMGMDPSIRHIYFNVPRTGSTYELYKPFENQKYIFVQQKSSDTFTNLITWDKDETLTLDPNVNMYEPGHKWHDLANTVVNKPFMDYVLLLENADEVHTVDSSFYCLACYLTLKAHTKRCYARDTGVLIPTYTFN
jgi:hypothetical protein